MSVRALQVPGTVTNCTTQAFPKRRAFGPVALARPIASLTVLRLGVPRRGPHAALDQRHREHDLHLPEPLGQRQALARRADGAALVRRRHDRGPVSTPAASTATCTYRDCVPRSTPRSPELSPPSFRRRRSSQPDAHRAATDVPRNSGRPRGQCSTSTPGSGRDSRWATTSTCAAPMRRLSCKACAGAIPTCRRRRAGSAGPSSSTAAAARWPIWPPTIRAARVLGRTAPTTGIVRSDSWSTR